MSAMSADKKNSSTSSSSERRETLNGAWILNKKRGSPSMRGYLETMGVTELAIEAHEKGEAEHDTIHIISLTDSQYRIHKISRVNDLTAELQLGKEHEKIIPPGNRVKKTLATSRHSGHVQIVSSMPTMNGPARVTDVKNLVQEENGSVLVQELTIVNQTTHKSHTTVRYFVPHTGTIQKVATTAGGSRRGDRDELDEEEDEDED